jgi:hypothetical protein
VVLAARPCDVAPRGRRAITAIARNRRGRGVLSCGASDVACAMGAGYRQAARPRSAVCADRDLDTRTRCRPASSVPVRGRWAARTSGRGAGGASPLLWVPRSRPGARAARRRSVYRASLAEPSRQADRLPPGRRRRSQVDLGAQSVSVPSAPRSSLAGKRRSTVRADGERSPRVMGRRPSSREGDCVEQRIRGRHSGDLARNRN